MKMRKAGTFVQYHKEETTVPSEGIKYEDIERLCGEFLNNLDEIQTLRHRKMDEFEDEIN